MIAGTLFGTKAEVIAEMEVYFMAKGELLYS